MRATAKIVVTGEENQVAGQRQKGGLTWCPATFPPWTFSAGSLRLLSQGIGLDLRESSEQSSKNVSVTSDPDMIRHPSVSLSPPGLPGEKQTPALQTDCAQCQHTPFPGLSEQRSVVKPLG